MNIHISLQIESNENPSLCSACAGERCKRKPGLTIPTDWGNNEEEIKTNLLKALDSGMYCIDPWEGDPRYESYDWDNLPDDYLGEVKMVRPSGSEHVGKLFHRPWFEPVPCVFLTKKGCSHSFEKRPFACKAYTPRFEDDEYTCFSLTTGREIAIQWVPYQPMMVEIVNKLQGA